MYFRKEENADGEYLAKDGVRFTLQQARRVRPAEGWTVFETQEDCLTAWGLSEQEAAKESED